MPEPFISASVEFDPTVALTVLFALIAGGGGGAGILFNFANSLDTASKRSCSSDTKKAGSSWGAFFSCSAPTDSNHAFRSRA